MMKTMAVWLVLVTMNTLFLVSCATTERTYHGAGAGGAIGAGAGALIDQNNRWRGALIGGLLGAALGGTVTEVSARAAQEAARSGQPVTYQSADGVQRVEAAPVGFDAQTQCQKVQERVWQDGKLVKDETKELCEGQKHERTY